MMKDVTILPGRSVFFRPVITPAFASAMTPSDSISVWMPRSLRSLRPLMTASGMRPIPICSVAPSGMSCAAWCPIWRQTSSSGSGLSS